MDADSGAEPTVWPPELFPEVATAESEESRRGVKYFRPGDTIAPTLPNLGMRQYSLKVDHLLRKASVNILPVRKPLSALCSLIVTGLNVYFTHNVGCYAIHTNT